ncbi:MAG: Rne/Rng family ribonuclease [Gemmataceae bacterium]
MKKEMLINVKQSEECRIAILEDGVLEELYVERASNESYVGNIYKGRIVNIEPSIQAAFVDFGVGRNGFLHVSDVEPTYWRHLEQRGRPGDRPERGNGGRDRDRTQLPAYLQGMDLEEIEDRPVRVDRTLVNRPPATPSAPPAASPQPAPVAPAAPPAPPAPSARRTNDFAAGVDLDTPPEAPVVVPPPALSAPVEVEARDEPLDESAEPLRAHPETRIEDEGKSRRRSRGTTGRRRSSSRTSTPEETPTPEAAAPEEAPSSEPGDDPKPRLMDSAEHRTEKGSESSEEGTSSTNLDFDPDLFFPARPVSRPAAPAAIPTPPPAPMPPPPPPPAPLPPPVESAPPVAPPAVEAPAPTPVAEIPYQEPSRRSRQRPNRHLSLEDALEADLAEAEIGDEEQRPVTEERDAEPISTGPEVEAEADIDEDMDDGDFAPPSRGEGGRRGDRGDRGRGDRGERGDRGDRGDRGRGRGRRNDRGRDGGRPGAGRPRPLIQDIFKRGQEVIVQVIKEGIGSKGPTLSTYISIPGRYLVLMPCLNRTGVSRKIEDDEQRRRLRMMFNELKPPKGLGFIMRTAAIDKNKREVQRDLVYLCRLWEVVARRIRKIKSPAEIYQESEMVTRTIRDNFSSDIDTIWVDEKAAFEAAQEFMQVVMPRYADRIKFYEGREPLFHKFGLENEIQRIHQKKIPLPNGGSIVIEQTEALVAIDVNSGNFRADNNAEETAYQMNLHAAREIARQLRLRDLGGVIVNDFIDMRDDKHRRAVERTLREAMRRDRARTKILRISQFGIIEMTRQRIRPSLKRSGYMDCPHCNGAALVKTPETMAIEIMRLVMLASCKEQISRVEVSVPVEVAEYLLNKRRREIIQIEDAGEMTVSIRGLHGAPPEHLVFTCLDRNDNEVRLTGPEPAAISYRPRR